MPIKIKRVYAPAEEGDGYRILVDRLWPRGIKKEDAHVDLWLKALAPSTELRKWFDHIPERFPEFAECYEAEVRANADYAVFLDALKAHDTVTLLFGAKDEEHNNAVVLKKMTEEMG
jgi:uncharacterized protein YeaO (DUF488 family)